MKNPKVKQFCFPLLVMAAYFAVLLLLGLFMPGHAGQAALIGDLVSAVLFGILYYLDRKKTGLPEEAEKPFRPKMWFLVVFVGILSLIWLVSQAGGQVLYHMGLTAGASSYTDMSKNESSFYVVTSIFVAPIAEELVFRGFGYRMWKRLVPVLVAALLSSAVFTAYHMSFIHIPVAMTVGLFSCVLYEMTGRLRYSVIFHMIYNLMSAGVFIPVSSQSALMKPYVSLPLCIAVWVFAFWCLFHTKQIRQWSETSKLIDKMNEPGADLSMFDKKKDDVK